MFALIATFVLSAVRSEGAPAAAVQATGARARARAMDPRDALELRERVVVAALGADARAQRRCVGHAAGRDRGARLRDDRRLPLAVP